MKCVNCDAQLPASSVFCPTCGTLQTASPSQAIVIDETLKTQDKSKQEVVPVAVEEKQHPISHAPTASNQVTLTINRTTLLFIALAVVLIIGAFGVGAFVFSRNNHPTSISVSSSSSTPTLKATSQGMLYSVDFSDNQPHDWQVSPPFQVQNGALTDNDVTADSCTANTCPPLDGISAPYNVTATNFTITFHAQTSKYFYFEVRQQPSELFDDWSAVFSIYTDHLTGILNQGKNTDPNSNDRVVSAELPQTTFPANTNMATYKFVVQGATFTLLRDDAQISTGTFPRSSAHPDAPYTASFDTYFIQIKDFQVTTP